MRLLPFCLLIGALACLSGLLVLGCSAGAFAFTGGTGGRYSGAGGAAGGAAGSSFSTGFGGQLFVSSGSDGSGGSWSNGAGDAAVPSSSTGAGGGGGATSASGDCDSGGDCASGSCVAVTPGGFRVCVVPPVAATTCSPGDKCCPMGEQACPDGGVCDVGPLIPACAAGSAPYNQCASDQCATDADCASSQICAPAGTLGLGVRACVTAACKVDADCTAYPGGVCAPVQEPCCSATAGLYCEYPGYGGCRTSSDCPSTSAYPNQTCVPDVTTGVASCQDSGPVCPS